MKRYFIAILITLLLASGILTGCATTESYINEEYGYSIDYPSDWVVDKPDNREYGYRLQSVYIHPYKSETKAFAFINIHYSPLSIEEEANIAISTSSKGFSDYRVLSSKPLEGNWDWLIEYTFTFQDDSGILHRMNGKNYLKKHNDLLYYICLIWEADSMPTEMKVIVNSFQVK